MFRARRFWRPRRWTRRVYGLVCSIIALFFLLYGLGTFTLNLLARRGF